jgi:phage-related protein
MPTAPFTPLTISTAIYVLHVFQRTKRGIATPKLDIDLIRNRFREAERDQRKAELICATSQKF